MLIWALACKDSTTETRSPGTSSTDPTHTIGHTTTSESTPWPTDPTGSTPTGSVSSADRRYDCSGMDPADPAPLGGHVFLTFDDGPNPATTPQALDVLRSYGVPATFLMLGENATDPAAAAIVDDILADPLFDIGNHTWDHQDLADLDLADAEAEMDDTTDALAGLGVTPTFFRFPYGDSTCATHDAATSRGYRVLGWHIDTADWCYAAGDGVCTTADYWRVPEEYESDMVGLSMEQIRRFDGGIVLFHDIHAWTVDQLPAFIDAVLAEGFTFAAVDDASLLPNLNAGTPADLPWLGEPCSVSDDRCWEVEHAAWCEAVADGSDEGVCTLSCEGYCLDRDGAATTFCADAGGAGQCIGRADPLNDDCAAVPGTVKRDLDRFVGASGAPDATVSVCAPSTW